MPNVLYGLLFLLGLSLGIPAGFYFALYCEAMFDRKCAETGFMQIGDDFYCLTKFPDVERECCE